jgi:hypothetical protein
MEKLKNVKQQQQRNHQQDGGDEGRHERDLGDGICDEEEFSETKEPRDFDLVAANIYLASIGIGVTAGVVTTDGI